MKDTSRTRGSRIATEVAIPSLYKPKSLCRYLITKLRNFAICEPNVASQGDRFKPELCGFPTLIDVDVNGF